MPTLNYYTLDVVLDDESHAWPSSVSHDGLEEYAIDEAEVDRLLGEKAFSGGDVDAETIALIEAQLEGGRYRLYFHGEQAKARAQAALEKALSQNIEASLLVHDQQDWNEKWRQGYETVKISNKLWIVPSWQRESESIPSGVTALYLYPGQGFGTGRHETTSLCLELFERQDYSNKTVLDFGCGSGILGIAASLRYQCNVDYLDIDASALENTVQNLEENQLAVDPKKIILRSNFNIGAKKYDLVFANILLDILVKEQIAILASLRSGSTLIVSGLLNEHVEAFRLAYPMLKEVKHISQGDWSAIELVQP